MQPLIKFIQLGTRAWWARVLYKVPESTKLGYQSGYFEKKLMNQPSFQLIYPDWYSSLVGSGTSQSTRAHQARVPIWVFFEKRLMNQPLFKEYISCVHNLLNTHNLLYTHNLLNTHNLLYTHNEVIPWYNNTMESDVELLRNL